MFLQLLTTQAWKDWAISGASASLKQYDSKHVITIEFQPLPVTFTCFWNMASNGSLWIEH